MLLAHEFFEFLGPHPRGQRRVPERRLLGRPFRGLFAA
jgi:hypothetical protein